MAGKAARVKPFSELSPGMQKRYMRTLRVDDPKQAVRILRTMEERGISRKRLRGHAPESKARPAKPGKTPLPTLRKQAARYIAKTLDRPDALYMLVDNSKYLSEDDVYRALAMDEEALRSEASRPPEMTEDGMLVNPFWYHPTAYDSVSKWSA